MPSKKQDGLVGNLYGITFNHTYRVGLMGGTKRHACLMEGYWCWQNVREHPRDVWLYIKRKRRSRDA